MSHHRARYFGLVFCLLLLLAFTVAPVFAAGLSFSIDFSDTNLYINADGTATVDYVYSFVNDSGGDKIDFVDIGIPTNSYDLANVSAEIDGKTITDIAESPYVKPGVALGLGSGTIQPGQRGTLHVTITNIGKMLYKTTKVENAKEAYASFEFSPNSFGSQYAHGNTKMSVTLHLPTGINSDEPRYFTPQHWAGNDAPETGMDNDGRAYYRWIATDANSYTQYIFGAAFPARIVPVGSLNSEPIISSNALDAIFPWICCLGVIGMVIFIIWISIVSSRKRSMQYLPPKISVEGNGIKRGLTAVQAAVLMETPMDKVLSMILYACVKKGAVQVTNRDPLTLKALTLPASAELLPYEKDFVDAMTTEGIKPADRRKKLQDLMVILVRNVTEAMRGFSRKETVAYYTDIMKRAWEQVESANTPDVQVQALDQGLEWTMLDRNFTDRSQSVFTSRPIIVPMWWGRYDPSMGRASAGPSGPTQVGQAPSTLSLPSLPGSAFAASVAGGIQSVSSGLIGDLNSFTSNITNTTNPVPKPTSSGRSGGGGGHSCACACACAGCACACAGGGR
jgi:hypothetical protein